MACQLCYNAIQNITYNSNQTLIDEYIKIAYYDTLFNNETCNSLYILFITLLNNDIIYEHLQLCLFELISRFMYI